MFYPKFKFHLFDEINSFYFLCSILILLAIYAEILKRQNFRGATKYLPTAYGLPFIGIAYRFVPVKKFLYVLESYFEKFKCLTYCTWLGTDPFVITVDPDIIKTVVSSEEFINKARTLYTPIDNAIPNGIITSSTLKWKHNRKLMNSTFSHKILASFVPVFQNGTNYAIQRLDALVGTTEHPIYDIFKRIILKIALETTLGHVMQDGNVQDEKIATDFNYMIEQIATDAVFSTLHMGFLVHTPKYYATKQFITDRVEDMIHRQYNKKDTIINNNNERKLSESDAIKKSSDIFINQALLFHERGLFEKEDVISETKTVIAGSFETVSTTVYSVLVMLAMHTDVQEKLYDEVVNILPTKDTEIEYNHLKLIPYMDMIIDETLRLMPSIPVIGRQTVKETALTADIIMPKGMQVMIPLFILHRRKDVWGPNANDFNPDNFLPENVSRRNPYVYMPFSKGLRNCIGMRYAHIALRVMLLSLVRHFRFSTTFKYENLVFMDHVSLRYDVEPSLSIERRP